MSIEPDRSNSAPTKVEYGPWGDRPIKYMIYWTDDYVVYINEKVDIDFEFDELEHPNIFELNRLLNEATILETSVTDELDENNRIRCKTLIGEVIACAIEGDYENAKAMLVSAGAFVQARRQEKSRIWYVSDSGFATVAIVVVECLLCLVLYFIFPADRDLVVWLALGAGAGVVGSFVSILARSGNLQFDPSSGRMLHRVEAGSRIFVGFISGLITVLAIKSKWILPTLATDGDPHLAVLIVAFVAGGGERLVTSIISDVNALGLKGSDTIAPGPSWDSRLQIESISKGGDEKTRTRKRRSAAKKALTPP
jgi:hypothetical protein